MTARPNSVAHCHAMPARRWPGLSGLVGPLPDRQRALQLELGVIWLLDAALQYQPFMFTRGFVSQVIQPGASGNPAFIAGPIAWSAALMARHIVFCNAMFATVQLLIAIGLLYRPTVRTALAASIPWAVAVWWIGEGLGSTLVGTASPLTGAPGAVILYAFLALLAWPPDPSRADRAPAAGSVAATGPLGRLLPRVLWAALWGSLAGFAVLPANRSPNGLSAMLSGMEAGEPGWIRAMDAFGVRVLAQRGTTGSVIIAVLCALAAVAVASGRLTRAAVVLAALLGAVFWVTEDFGAIFTGQGTDPNSGLLLIVLAAAFWPIRCPAARPGLRSGLGGSGPRGAGRRSCS